MPEIDLSPQIPEFALWVKIHYEMKPVKPGADLIARLWSASMKDSTVIKGASGDVFVKLTKPQRLSYQRPVTVDLKLKVVAFRTEGE